MIEFESYTQYFLQEATNYGKCIINFIENNRRICAFIVLPIVSYKGFTYYKKLTLRQKWNSFGKDVVILHGVRSTTCPSVSPFVIKLELFLRMAGIKYTFDRECPIGPKGKTPWITFNRQDIGDSELIFDFLKDRWPEINLNMHLSLEQKATARAFQVMMDEHLFWGLTLSRWYFDKGRAVLSCWNAPWYYKWVSPWYGKEKLRRAKCQGIGRHTEQEMIQIFKKDIEAISNQLGCNRYMMGDRPSEVDCAAFGLLAQFIWVNKESPYAEMIEKDYGNIVEYCYTIKSNFYPDWLQWAK